MKVGYSTNAWAPVLAYWAATNNVNGAYYYSPGSAKDAIKGIANAGFEQAEIFDGNLLDFDGNEREFAAILDECGVELLAVYCAANFIYDEILPEELYRIEKAMSVARSYGAGHVALGGGATRFDGIREDDYRKLAAGLDKVCDIADRLGMVASFHPHMGSLVESPEQIDKVMPYTRIALCPDTGHVVLGGGDPVEVTRKYADRIKYFHLKDITVEEMFCPLGVGYIDFPAIVKILESTDNYIQYVVECDGWDGNPNEGAKLSAGYIREKINGIL